MASELKPFMLLAKLQMRSEDAARKDISGLKEVGKFESQQKQCGSYLCVQPLEGDKTTLTVFESYDNKDYLMNDHRASNEYQALQENVKKEDTRAGPVSPSFYIPKGGFIVREKPSTVPPGDQFIWIAKFKAKPGKRPDLMSAILRHTANVTRDEDETLSFLVLESTDDDVSVVLFERYTSEKYFKEVHFTSDSMKEYRSKLPDTIEERISEGYHGVAGFVDKREALI